MNSRCPPLLLKNCCHPSENPHQPQSSPAADSLLVPLAVEDNRRDAKKNKWMQGWIKQNKIGDGRCDRREKKLFSMQLKVAINHRGASQCVYHLISYQ